jgi:nucleotide-binding universal stress UspA family protein
MYKKILVALENSRADKALLPRISELARMFQSELLLVHVADGWVARNYERLKLADSEEMKEDRAYLARVAGEIGKHGTRVSVCLAMGDPSTEILRVAKREHCDLIAMTMHGHGFLADLLFGSTIREVRHKALVPMFLVPAK